MSCHRLTQTLRLRPLTMQLSRRWISTSMLLQSKRMRRMSEESEDEELFINLGGGSYVNVTIYDGEVRVDIRKWYTSTTDDVLKPTKYGISLTVDQWKKLKTNMTKVNNAVKEQLLELGDSDD